jgi:peptidoglycan/xylan/chitin deacetylase (PgdA/CDA1 family)
VSEAAEPLRVALTFDAEHPDRPNEPGVTERILDTLAREGVTATFFIQGRWAEAYPFVARSVADAGHLVGNHSHYHARMPLLSDDGLIEDIADAGRAIEDATGVDPRPWFRCPFGAGSTDPRVLAALHAARYRHVGEHVAAEDWEPYRIGAAIEADLVAGTLARGDGTVVLLHAWPRATLDALPGTIARLRDAGARFVRVDELGEVPSRPTWA